jgi:NAD(P)H-dependent flavin oxidoreductase YrpB (nitropropane dioxygenase family)
MRAILMENYQMQAPIIQGGMGIGVSDWRLARAVSRRGQIGVVSGTAIDSLFVRRLQDGDPGGHMRRALAAFPLPDVAGHALSKYFLANGRNGAPYRLLPMWRHQVTKSRECIAVLAAFVEVWLAKEGHTGSVGINLLAKVQLPNLATLYGAMLASVDYVIMGAGIPKDIPAVLDSFAEGRSATIRLDVEGLERGEHVDVLFDPHAHFPHGVPMLKRPWVLPVGASHALATMLLRKSNGRVDGFVVEGPTAGGHNAPPRGQTTFNERGEPVYGERDVVDLEAMRALGVPFWLAGGMGSPAHLRTAISEGAAGIQVGTLFAFASESGVASELKESVLEKVGDGTIDITTDPMASPTGFPFKVVQLDTTNSSPSNYENRERICDLGYLRTAYRTANGRIGYRCAAEPVDAYVSKGGDAADTVGRKCLCNSLMANVSHGQVRDGDRERPLLTSGDDIRMMRVFTRGRTSYSAGDVIDYLTSTIHR